MHQPSLRKSVLKHFFLYVLVFLYTIGSSFGASAYTPANADRDKLLRGNHLDFGQAAACATSGDLEIFNNETCTLPSGTYTYNSIVIRSGGYLILESNTLSGQGTELIVNYLTIENGAFIHANGQGYPSASGPGKGTNGNWAWGQPGGAGHGGLGGIGAAGYAGGSTYGNLYSPDSLGSGGGSNGGVAGGAGGGAIHLVVNNGLEHNGTISANGLNGISDKFEGGGGGSGGSIWITANSMSGQGSIHANGGSGGSSWYYGLGGGGAGGHITIDVPENANLFTGTVTAYGNQGNQTAGAGTIYWTNKDKLIIDNGSQPGLATILPIGSYEFSTMDIRNQGILRIVGETSTIVLDNNTIHGDNTGRIEIEGTVIAPSNFIISGPILAILNGFDGPENITTETSGGLELHGGFESNNLFEFNNVYIGSGSTLRLVSFNNGDVDVSDDHGITLSAENITVAGTLDANGKGYPSAMGPGKGANGNWANGQAGGAGHGSDGGDGSSNYAGGSLYGDLYFPSMLGSGGGTNGESAGGAGGGAIRIIVADQLDVTGTISANGLNGASGKFEGGGGGSGGSIWITSDRITGSGFIQANGGSGGSSWYYGSGGGGAGGRIALFTNYLESMIQLTVQGGNGHQSGGVGTIYLDGIDSSKSTIEIIPDSIIADGSNLATITVTIRNADNYPIPGQEVEIALAAGSDVLINDQSAELNQYISLGNTDENGQVTASLKTTRSGNRVLVARAEQIPLAQQASVNFTAGPVSATNSTISFTPAGVPADGQTPITVTVTARDAYNNPIPNATVELSATGSAVVTQPVDPTNSMGRTSGQVVNSVAETTTVSATIDGTALSNSATLSFVNSDLSVSLSAPASAVPNTSIQYAITIRQSNEAPAENVVLELELPSDASYISQTSSVIPAQNGQVITWNFGTLSPGQQLSFDVNVHISADATLGNQLTAESNVSTSTTETTLANNVASSETTIVDGLGFNASIDPSSQTAGIGAEASYTIHIDNTGLVQDIYNISVSGLDPELYNLAQENVSLSPGGLADIGLIVQANTCSASGNVSFEVEIASAAGQQTVNLAAEIDFLSSPQFTRVVPNNNQILGSRDVTINWETDTPSTGILTIFPADAPENALTFDTAEGTSHTVFVPNLTRNTTYIWSVIATSECGTTILPERTFRIGNGIVFVNRTQSYTIDRDYEQRVSVEVRNEDSSPHTLTTSVLNSHEDLIINFIESGSTDQTIELQPGESKNIVLVVHAQDTELRDYQVLAHLVSEQEDTAPIIDNILLNIKVLAEGDYSIVEDTAAFDPLTLGKTYVITNHGKVITDLSLKAIDPGTGLPANVLIQPSIDHARLETGGTLRIVVYPIFGPEDVSPESGSTLQDNSLQLVAFSQSTELSSRAQTTAIKNFTLEGSGAGHTVNVAGSTSCPAGKQIYPVQIKNATCEFTSSDWYCTNRPNIVTPLSIPAFLSQADIESASLGLQFTPRNNVLPHTGTISVNGAQIGSFSETIPNGNFTFNIPSQSLNGSVAGLATQNIELNTLHNNSGHYVSSSNYVLGISVRQAATYACATSAEAAAQAVMSTYSCRPSYSFNPWTDIFSGSTFNWGEIKKFIRNIAAELGYKISTVSCSQEGLGDPINTRTGVFSIALPDISFPTPAGDLVFQRAYSSGTADLYASDLGYGWTHNHDSRLIFPTDPTGMEGFVLFKDFLGNQHLFGIEADGSYRPGPGVLAILEKSASSPDRYTLTTTEQTRLEFDEDGRILSRANANGHQFDYSYDDDGKLVRISYGQGDTLRSLDLSYDEQGRIISVSDYAGRQVVYAYDTEGNLISSVDLLGQSWSYNYDSAHHMTQLIDPSGTETVTTEYDMNGRAWRQFDGEDNLIVRIVFNADGSTTAYDGEGNAQTHSSNQRCVVTEKLDELGRATNTEYNGNFQPTLITNAAGHSLQMEWSEDGRNLLSETDPAGNTTTYTYDDLNNLSSTTDPLGNVTTYSYDGTLLISKTAPDGKTTSYTYTVEGWLETETDSYGRVTAYTYDAYGQKTSVTNWRGQTTTYTYDELGHLVETTDPRGRISRSEYNVAGQLLRSISNYDPNRPQNDENLYNIITSYEYDLRGNQVSVTNTLNQTTRYEYNDADRLVRTIDPAGNETTNSYDANGRLVSSTDALDNLTTYVYDAVGRRLSTINALGHSSGTTTFNIPANTSTAIDALGHSATYYYDELNRVVKVVDPLGNETTTTYTTTGNVATRTDQLGRVTRYEYDNLGRLVQTIDPLGGTTQTVYDSNGNRVATIDPLGNQTSYVYDEQGRLISTTDALGNTTSNQYDEDGNLVATTDALGRTTTTEYDEWGRRTASTDTAGRRTTYTYDALDRVIATTGPSGTTTTTYNALGNIIARTDEHERVSNTIYDVLGRVVSTTDFSGNTITNEYDDAGNLISTTSPQGTVTYTYDALNRRIATTDTLGNTSRIVYDRLGNITHEINANEVVTYYGYDLLNRNILVINNYRPTMQPDSETNVRVEYTYNAVGNRTHVKDANGNVTEFEYEALNRVTRKIDPVGNTWQYEYDLAGNMVSRTDGNGKTTTFTYDALGQLTLIDYPDPDTDVSFTYNDLGQRVSMTDGLGTTTWSYDDLSRLVSVTDPYEKTVTYRYDEQGNRIGLEYPDGKLVTSNYDDDNRLADVANWDSQTTEYEYDSLGQLLSILRPNGIASAYTFDQAGQLALLEHSSGDGVLAKYEYTYDAVGNIIQAREHTSGATAISPTVLVTVMDTAGAPLAGETIYAVSEGALANYNQVTNEQGQALFSLPKGTYRFRTEIDGIQFWSGTEEHCQVGRCEQAILTIPQPVLVTVLDSDQIAQAGLSVSAYNGEIPTDIGGTTDENGQVQLRLPAGDYRFRADFNGTTFWSEATNHCQVPGCTMAQVNVNLPVTVTVSDSVWNVVSGQTVYAYQDSTYSGFSAVTNEAGEAQFTLPSGDYRFRTEFGGETFWSDASVSCSIPGCSAIDLQVALPLTISVLDTQGQPVSDVSVEVFDGENATGQSGTTGADGATSFTLPAGNYRFRATYQNIEFWSGEENHCEVFSCSGATITVSEPALPTSTPTANPEPTITLTPASGGFNPLPEIPGTPGPETSAVQSDKTKVLSSSKRTGISMLAGDTDVTITVLDADGTPRAGVPLLAFDGITPTEYNGTTDENGQATLSLPEGNYRFRAEFEGVYYWSYTENHCTVPGCNSAIVTVALPVTVNIYDPDTRLYRSGATVHVYQGMTDTGYSGLTDENGDVHFTLPVGNYRFMVELDNAQFFSEVFDHCDVPNCRWIGMWVFGARNVTVRQKDGTLVEDALVEAYTDTAYTGLSGTTDENGIARITLPSGWYRFRVQVPSGEYWSGEQVHCKTPDCRGVTVVVDTFDTIPISVLNTHGTPQGMGHNVTAFTGESETGQNAATDDDGQAILTLLEGQYRFRAIYEGVTFWSQASDHCAIPGCSGAIISVTLPIEVTVRNSDNQPISGADVYAFDGDTYTNFSAATDDEGRARFILPVGNYRFRVDVNGVQYWSGLENHLTLHTDWPYVDITINEPVSVSVVKGGAPVADMLVSAYQGEDYIGQAALTGEDGKASFNLPSGVYRFRVEHQGQEYWSQLCELPSCNAAQVNLPGELAEMNVVIDYEYDALNRLTSATYSNGIAFHYSYDAAGNVLEYSTTGAGQTTITTYTYDAANQLTSAAKDSSTTSTGSGQVWHYAYDGNGSLILSTSGDEVANGAKGYAYNTAGFLVKVETYVNGWQTQAEMAYDGLGNRLQMTAAGLTTQYELDNGRVLSANPSTGSGQGAAGNTTFYLYGLGLIGELTDDWNYSLPDGSNTPRQLSDAAGEVTYFARYTPWGDTLEVYGSGSFSQGYFGGLMDEATGLIYVGNGQYYDPETGRFLTRDARPSQNNPYTPIDPTSAMLAPLALLALVFGRKKSCGKWDNIIIILVLFAGVGISLTGCNQQTYQVQTPSGTTEVVITPNSTGATVTVIAPNGEQRNYELTPEAPTEIPGNNCITISALTSGYYIPTESQAEKYYGGIPVPIPAPSWAAAEYLVRYDYRRADLEFSHNWALPDPPAQYANEVLLYDHNYTCLQGSAQLDLRGNSQYIKCDTNYWWNDYIAQNDARREEIAFRWASDKDTQLLNSLVPFKTVAVCDKSTLSGQIQLFGLPESTMKKLRENGNPEAIFDVVDVGQGLCPENSHDGNLRVDIFTGVGENAFNDAREYFYDKPVDICQK